MHNIKQDKPRGLFSYKAPRNVTLILNTALPNAYIFHDVRPLSPRKIPVYFVVFLCFFGTKIIACFKAFSITQKTFTIRIVNVKHYVYSIVLAVKLWERKKERRLTKTNHSLYFAASENWNNSIVWVVTKNQLIYILNIIFLLVLVECVTEA